MPSCSLYQPGEEVDVLTELLSTSSPGWYRYQLGGEVKLLAGLVQVPAQWGGQPPRRASTGTSSVGRSSSFARLVQVPARWGGQPPCRAGTGISSVGRSTSSPVGHPLDDQYTDHPLDD
ncbi:hypothetical protein PCANC_08461 [Puccinia coronata f. sp. avenae]|uniref:Uncharacterized protein n=1 Tax=Puccinia coronata f. sp. avenae TaxID=200324 RepID=A0A2N5T4A3_9BASI|nr:hypothetical protein PCANC_08461 [Puccinia coronata f. sp. avenae]